MYSYNNEFFKTLGSNIGVSCGVSCAILGSDNKYSCVGKELLAKGTELTGGNYDIIFSAPEAILGVSRWRKMLIKPPYSTLIAAVVVDEAHCVSKWYSVMVIMHQSTHNV